MTDNTHKMVNEMRGNTQVITPGSVHGFWDDATLMILDTESREVEVIHLYGEAA